MSAKRCDLCDAPMPWPDHDPDADFCSDECLDAYEALDEAKWPIALGHAIARFVRRAEVAGLVEAARRGTRHARPCIDAADETCGCCVGSSRTAIDALARLAGGGA